MASDPIHPNASNGSAQALSPKAIEQFNQGLQLHQAGNLEGANACYQSALVLQPNFAPALQYLGVLAAQQNDFPRSVELITKAISANPLDANAYLNRGLAQAALQRHELSLADFRQARTIAPNHVDAFFNEGNALQELRRYAEAIDAYKSALALAPDYALAHNNLGNAQQEIKDYEGALKSYESAIKIAPNYADAFFNCGTLFHTLKNYQKAIVFFNQSIALNPNAIEAHINAGYSYDELVQIDKSMQCYEAAIKLDPHSLDARFAKALRQIPKIYTANADPKIYRKNFSKELEALDVWTTANPQIDGYKVVGNHQPFFLAYQEENNVSLLSQYGDICSRLMKELQPTIANQQVKEDEKNKVRLGIISSHIHSHSVWNAITKGWLMHLNQDDFEIHIFHLGETVDRETEIAKSLATSYIQGNLSIQEWINIISEKNLDLILFPEVGMDKLTCQLASLRLAPKQLVTWGHPETTGLPHIDYYISAANFENETSQNNYREKLVSLPNLGCFYSAYQGAIKNLSPADLNLDPNRPILLCPGAPFKYAPQFDYALVEIAKKARNAQLAFFKFPDTPVDILEERLSAAFDHAGLKLTEHVVFLPRLSTEEFYGLMKISDVFVDTIGFSGFNTAIQAIECNLPIVTYEGKFMRGRLASGILKRMGMDELICPDVDSFITKVVQLASNGEYRALIKDQIATLKPVLFEDQESARALNQLLIDISAA